MNRSTRLAAQLTALRAECRAVDANEPDAATHACKTASLSRQAALIGRLLRRAQAGERALRGGRVSL